MRSAIRWGGGAKPEFSLLGDQKLGYLDARRRIYLPMYRDAVANTAAYALLEEMFRRDGRVTLWDYDGYDRNGRTLREVLEDPKRIMGHSFVLAMMLAYGAAFQPEDLV